LDTVFIQVQSVFKPHKFPIHQILLLMYLQLLQNLKLVFYGNHQISMEDLQYSIIKFGQIKLKAKPFQF